MGLTENEIQIYYGKVKQLDEATTLDEVESIGKYVTRTWLLERIRAIPAGVKAPAIESRRQQILGLGDEFQAKVKARTAELLPAWETAAKQTIYDVSGQSKDSVDQALTHLNKAMVIIEDMLDLQRESAKLGRQLQHYDPFYKPATDFQVSGLGVIRGTGRASTKEAADVVYRAIVAKYTKLHRTGNDVSIQTFVMPSSENYQREG